MAWVASSHHVLGVEHLLSELRNSKGAVLLATTAGQWGKARHEEVQTWEWNHVHSQFAEISVKLTRETKASGDTRHGCTNEMVQIAISWVGQLEGTEADVVQSLVVDAVGFISILDKLMDGEGGVVRFHNGVRDLGYELLEEFILTLGDGTTE